MSTNEYVEKVKGFIRLLASGWQQARMYGKKHKKFKEYSQAIYDILQEIFPYYSQITIGIAGTELFFRKEVFFDLSSQLKDFVRDFRNREVHKIRFSQELTMEELEEFLMALSLKPQETGDFQKYLFEKGVINIAAGKILKDIEEGIKTVEFQETLRKSEGFYEEVMDGFSEVLKGGLGAEGDLEHVSRLSFRLFNLVVFYKNFLYFLMYTKKYDDYTYVHLINVGILSMLQAKNLGFSKDEILRVGLAGFFHDVGKIFIAKNILNKPGALDSKEFEHIKSHTIFGTKILLNFKDLDKIVPLTAFSHHLGIDGKGYPQSNFLKKPNVVSTIVSISDVYDSLRTRRSYRGQLPPEDVYDIMQKEASRKFDPYLLEKFFQAVGIWPPGTFVELKNGMMGIVVENHRQDLHSPTVEIFYNENGEKLAKSFTINLADPEIKKEENFKIKNSRTSPPEGFELFE